MNESLPVVISRYLERHGLVTITTSEFEELRELRSRPNPSPDMCPYPLSYGVWGPTHSQTIGHIEHEGTHALAVARCAACHHVTIEELIAIA